MLGQHQRNIIHIKIFRAEQQPNQSIALGILAGMFISIGALLMSIAKAEGCNKIVCGMIFSCGLFFVVITGAELFTGNCIIPGLTYYEPVMNTLKCNKLLIISYISNLIGAVFTVIIIVGCGIDQDVLIKLALDKCNTPGLITLIRGFACNILVCLAIWLGVYIEPTQSKLERFIAIIFPVTAFVACGFEHSIADMFILPFGLIAGQIDILQVITQLLLVTFGNYFGGIFLGALISETMREG